MAAVGGAIPFRLAQKGNTIRLVSQKSGVWVEPAAAPFLFDSEAKPADRVDRHPTATSLNRHAAAAARPIRRHPKTTPCGRGRDICVPSFGLLILLPPQPRVPCSCNFGRYSRLCDKQCLPAVARQPSLFVLISLCVLASWLRLSTCSPLSLPQQATQREAQRDKCQWTAIDARAKRLWEICDSQITVARALSNREYPLARQRYRRSCLSLVMLPVVAVACTAVTAPTIVDGWLASLHRTA